jgi:hypothetical protein
VHGSTAGLVLHINEFMAKKLQHFLKDGGIELPQSPDSPKRFFYLNIFYFINHASID